MFVEKSKKNARLRRAGRTRSQLRKLKTIRLVVYRTSRHIYAQIITYDPCTTIVVASTLEKNISQQLRYTGNKEAAIIVGQHIAERAILKGITKVSFDRSGFKYHGRILELANSARKFGLIF